VPALLSTVLNSAVGAVDRLPDGLRARGYAVGGAQGGRVTAVDASVDGGRTWVPARITYNGGAWGWALWEAELPLPPPEPAGGACEVWCRATDAAGVRQLPDASWNLRGVCYNGYGRMAL
jgi:sulfite oxidase